MSNLHSLAEKEPRSLVKKTKQTLAEIADAASRWTVGGWPTAEPRSTQELKTVYQETGDESDLPTQAVTTR